MTRCRRQRLQWRWPGNPNGRSKFCYLGLFTFTRSQLALRRRLRGWWRLPEIAQTSLKHRSNIAQTSSAMTRIDRNSANTQTYAYEIKQSVSKNFFLLLWTPPQLTELRTVYFPAITRNGFCFHIRKIISRRPWSPPKHRDIHIRGFFNSIYSKTIDIIRNQIFFSIFKHTAYVYTWTADSRSQFASIVLTGSPADGPNLQVVF